MNIFCEAKIHLDRKTMFHCHCCLISMGGQAMPWAMKVTGITFTRFSLPLKKITIKMRKYVKGRRRGHGRGISSGHSKRSWFGQWQWWVFLFKVKLVSFHSFYLFNNQNSKKLLNTFLFTEHGWGSWNISKTQGPLGDVCETNRLLSLTSKLNLTTKLK